MNVDLEILRRWSFDALPVLLDATIKGTLLLGAAAVTVLALRQTSAAARQAVWLLALAALLALPLASAILPSWQVLPGWATLRIQIEPAAAPAVLPGPSLPAPRRLERQPEAPAAPTVSAVVVSEFNPPEVPSPSSSATSPADTDHAGDSWRDWIVPAATGLWVTGVLVCLLPLALGRVSLWRLARRSRRLEDGAWATLAFRASDALGLRRRAQLLQSSAEPMPMVWGVFQQKLLLPAEAEDWPAERRWVVLLHELAHIKRRDCLAKLVAHVACACYWFNPLAWAAFKWMQRESEAACDDLVLAASVSEAPCAIRPSDYAQHLLEIAAGLKSGRLAAYLPRACRAGSSIAMARPSKLEGRLLAILDATRNRRALTRLGILVAAILVAGLVLPLACMKATPQNPTAPDDPAPVADSMGAPQPDPEAATHPALLRLRARVHDGVTRESWAQASREEIEEQLNGIAQLWLNASHGVDQGWRMTIESYLGKYFDEPAPAHGASRRPRLEVSMDDHGWLLVTVDGEEPLPAVADFGGYTGLVFWTGDIVAANPDRTAAMIERLTLLQRTDGLYQCGGWTLRREALRPANEPERATRAGHSTVVEGAYALDKPLTITAKLRHPPIPPTRKEAFEVMSADELTFVRKDGQIQANLAVGYSSWPKATYLAKLELLDSSGKVLASDKASVKASGIIFGQPLWMMTELTFPLGQAKHLAAASQWRLTLEIAASAELPATPPANDWGEPNNGVQARLRVEKKMWGEYETLTFWADIRNHGTGTYTVAQAQQLCQLELDGTRYRWAGDIDVKASALPPGREYNNIQIALTDDWEKVKTTPEGRTGLVFEKLQLTPGRHRLRVIFFCNGGSSHKNLVVETNPVEFEVAAPGVPVSELTFEALGFVGLGRPIRIETTWRVVEEAYASSPGFLTMQDGRAVFTGFLDHRGLGDDSVLLVPSIDLLNVPLADIPSGKKVTIPRAAIVRIERVTPTSPPAAQPEKSSSTEGAAAAAGAAELQGRVALASNQRTARAGDAQVREQFLAIERFARLPADEQARELPRFYRELAPRYIGSAIEMLLSSFPSNILDRRPENGFRGNTTVWAQQLAEAASDLSPEQVADKLGDRLWLGVAAHARVIHVLKAHPTETAALVREDLQSRQKVLVDQAGSAIVALQLRAFTDQLLKMFLANDELSESARRALLWVRDPAICQPLLAKVEQDPQFLARGAGLLQTALQGKPADPILLRLLDSTDAEIRYHAAYAVYECTDPKLAAPAVRLARDNESRFRIMAAHLAANLSPESFRAVRSELLPLLNDPDEEVRLEALRGFAQQKDLAAGPVILEFLRLSHDGPAEQREVTVMQALAALAGQQFGYDMHHWGTERRGNLEAIRQFEAWLRTATLDSITPPAGSD